MDPARAAAILGADPGESPDRLRRRFRRLLLAHHPDLGGSTDAAREVIEAYAALARDAAPDAEPDAARVAEGAADPDAGVEGGAVGDAPGPPEGEPVWRVDDDTLAVALPAEEAYVLAVEAAHRIGSVTYVDRQCGVLEALLRTTEGGTVSMLVTLQGRALGHTDLFFSLEPLDIVRGPFPALSEVTELMGRLMAEGAERPISGAPRRTRQRSH